MDRPADDRGVSPVVGVLLMVVLTILLASSLGFIFSIEPDERLADDVINGNLNESSDDSLQEELVVAEDATPGAENVIHTTVVTVDGAAGTTLDSITVDYPKDEVDHSTSQHEEIVTIGVDTDDDGDLEETFDEDDVSGVGLNDDDSRLEITFDTAYTLSTDDRVQVRYEGAENPDNAGEYDVSVELNGVQTEDGTLVIE